MMLKLLTLPLRKLTRLAGFDIVRHSHIDTNLCPADFSSQEKALWEKVSPFTMTSPERIKALADAVDYVCDHNVTGAFVECGVWKGGSALAMIHTLQKRRLMDRELFLYDTYSGMTSPGELDISIGGKSAMDEFKQKQTSENSSDWCLSPLDEVQKNLEATDYPTDKLHLIKGKVEETIPATVPDKIAILRLDTDWYESTKHELDHLYPLLAPGGVLIIDDYGHWEGARKAVDEYLSDHQLKVILHRIDATGRITVKPI